MEKIKAIVSFIAGLLEPVASIIARFPKGTLVVWAASLALTWML